MRVTVEYETQAGVVEQRTLRPGAAIDLLDRLKRQQCRVKAILSSEGETWTPQEARRQIARAVQEDYDPRSH